MTHSEKIHFFEEMSMNGHVALKSLYYDGWILRFSNGHTTRANSVSVIYPSRLSIEEKVSVCEEYYKNKKLPCQFKITEIDTDLNKFLEDRGYQIASATDLMSVKLSDVNFTTEAAGVKAEFSEKPTEEWLEAYFPFEALTDELKVKTFRQMLSKVMVQTIYCSLVKDGKIVACASAAIERGYMLLQNVVVSPERRGQGLGTILCKALIMKAKECGAENSYLQVLQTNDVALKLYKSLGYQKEYSYWYMKK